MSSWYRSSEARLRSAKAAWHCTLGILDSISCTSACTSRGSVWASFFRFIGSTAMLLSAVVQ